MIMGELVHYGVLGMHWGIRKDGKPQGFQYGGKNSTKRVASEIPKQKKSHSIDYDLARVNTGTKGGRKNNCTMCTVAYDMRRRGYDVKAGINNESGIKDRVVVGPDEFEEWYTNIERIDVAPTLTDKKVSGKKAKDRYEFYKKHSEEYIDSQTQLEENTIKEIQSQGDGARGKLGVLWQSVDGVGHSLQYEVRGDEVIILDAQKGERVDADRLFARVDPTKDVTIYRLDTAEPNYDLLINQGIIDYPGAVKHPMPTKAEFPEMSDFYKQNGMDAFIERYGPTQVSRIDVVMQTEGLKYIDDLLQYLDD